MTKLLKDTVFLPKTDFPMRGSLPTREREIFAELENTHVYEKLRKLRKGRKKYILHEGPPFANGHIHMGHALNRILKDVIVRGQSLLGKDVPVVPGWDCHGLPIEWKIEEKYREAGKDKAEVSPEDFRKECAAFAQHWIDVQRDELKRLGLMADWGNAYTTMNPQSEAAILENLGDFLLKGSLYRGFRPVMWSVVEKTALAEAEVEYHERTSSSIYVSFPITQAPDANLVGKNVVIWTTTPWTIPANRAIAYNADIKYVCIRAQVVGERSIVPLNTEFLIAADLCASFCTQVGIEKYETIKHLKGSAFAASICQHPFCDDRYAFNVPLLPATYVTTEAGTGFVHTAPSHGPDDFQLGRAHGLDVPETVTEDGIYTDQVPIFAGKHIFKVDSEIITFLRDKNTLLGASKVVHSYPHSWRSKAPLIYRATPQWFIELDRSGIRQEALQTIKTVSWIPESGEKRIGSMVSGRPDWCITRQRMWGVPLTVFVNTHTGEVLRDKKVHARIVKEVAQKGCGVWFSGDARRFLGTDYDHADYEPVYDILDVWFESGSSHAYVLQARKDLAWPADLYVEGSDQHRGWFQSSLLIGVATKGQAPYRSVLTHGFILDEKHQKMSKSDKNALSPLGIADEMGIEMVRLWVVGSDVSDDVTFGREILNHQKDIYRRFRNTIRYLLGALHAYSPEDSVAYDDLPDLEKWVLHRVWTLNEEAKKGFETFDFLNLYAAIHNFCTTDLSSFYFDVRKDSLYCDKQSSPKRRACRYVMHHVLDNLLRWLAPVLVSTTQEAWGHLYPGAPSIHLEELHALCEGWQNPRLDKRIATIREIRRVMTGALEKARGEGTIGSSLQAHVDLYVPKGSVSLKENLWAELAIVSSVGLMQGTIPPEAFSLGEFSDIGVVVHSARGGKCERCWRVLDEVVIVSDLGPVCERCRDVLKDIDE
ncbi:MAG: isoleucine--tRNA ligase [Alphaproteobacteria bacterium]|nr:MAG: isoleucine--tRNA ligase [Alphaproteobacteria bacterium]